MKEMTCREFDEVVHGFVRMELLDVNVRESALDHAAHCELCAERMADAATLADASEIMGKRSRQAETPPQMEASLLAAYRNYHRRASFRRTLEWVSVGAAAAVLLVFLWTVNGRSKGTLSPSPRKDVSSQSGMPLDAKTAATSKQDEAAAAAVVEHAVATNAPAAETYAASDFVPVPFTGAITPDDPGMIVRVQLTRSSLAQLGYPVAETPDEDLILADVLVGEDGWPRGVKLIQ
ncbi:MAG TPA: hypothetical protein VGP19_07225 [Candidatus Acidoferrales bacterium]|jgi:hypothetical protein|nr:hypothetical protein [Candidatus Acidoferrales bacterium]